MTDPSSYFTTWVQPHRLELSWLPGFFNPKYEELDNDFRKQPDYYQSLSDIVEVVRPSWRSDELPVGSRFHVVQRSGVLEIETIETTSLRFPIVPLPPEAIILTRLFRDKLLSTYWREDLYPGKGVASSNLIVLKPIGIDPVGWIINELKKDYLRLQIERITVGSSVFNHINIRNLLDLKVRTLQKYATDQYNKSVVDAVRNKTAIGRAYQKVIQGQKAVKPFFLTGATFREKLDQFEENLLRQSAIDTNRVYYIETSTSNPEEDLFVVRRVGPTEKKADFKEFFKPQADPTIDSEWRKWYWNNIPQNPIRVFNSLQTNYILPSHLLRRMTSIISIGKENLSIFHNTLLPTFSWLRDLIESHEYEDEINWIEIREDVTQKWIQLHIETKNLYLLNNIYSYYHMAINDDISGLVENTEFPDLFIKLIRHIFAPAIALKVIRETETAGVYLMFGAEESKNPFEQHAILEGIGQRLYQILEQPSEVIYDAARRESLRRLSDIMHRLNSPTGRILNALEDINKFLGTNTEIANNLLFDEETINRKVSLGRKTKEDYTLKSRINNIFSNISQIRQIVYKLKRLNMIQGSFSREKIDLANLFNELTASGDLINGGIKLSFHCHEESLTVLIHKDSIYVAIEEVIKNANRELSERNTPEPSIMIDINRVRDSALIRITDNALPPDVRLINRPFEEGSSTYARTGGGSGFGLFIVIEAFTKHDGTCQLYENVNKDGERLPGVTFEAKLPISINE
jgi:signal transduction histidine kinase